MNTKATEAVNAQDTVKLIGDLADYAERYADANGEPQDGQCRETIRKADAWRESGSATLDPRDLATDLIEYVERFADENGEPADGDCRRLLARAARIARTTGKAALAAAAQPAAGQSDLETARGLLREALGHITPKPWDDTTLLHARISEFLGEPVQYPDNVKASRQSNED